MSQARMVRDFLLFTSREDHVGFGVKASFTPRKIAPLALRMNILLVLYLSGAQCSVENKLL